jgi:1,4-alpha-glucan branching enzyme
MSAVHAEALAKTDAAHSTQRQSWWTRRYTIRFTALAGLATAASIAAVVALTATMLSRSPRSEVRQQSAISTVATTHFVLVNESAKQVYLVGDFNNWSKTPLTRAANQNAWTVSVPLNTGKHEYAFIVDDENGEHWVADPLSTKVEDEFGTESSIVRVGPTSS